MSSTLWVTILNSYHLGLVGLMRMCPGITMGSTTVMVTLANLLYHFDWEVLNGMKREDISLEENIGVSISRKSPLYLVPIIYDFEKCESSNVV